MLRLSCHAGGFLGYQAGITTCSLLWAKFLPSPFLLCLAAAELCAIFTGVLLNLLLSDSWESNSFYSNCHFCESKHMITYQKISVLDRKKIEAEYNQDLCWFSVVTVLSPFSHACVIFLNLFQGYTRKCITLFINSHFHVSVTLGDFRSPLQQPKCIF